MNYKNKVISVSLAGRTSNFRFAINESADYWYKTNKYIIDYVHIYQIDGQEIYFTN